MYPVSHLENHCYKYLIYTKEAEKKEENPEEQTPVIHRKQGAERHTESNCVKFTINISGQTLLPAGLWGPADVGTAAPAGAMSAGRWLP